MTSTQPKTYEQIFVVPRDSREETTLAIVKVWTLETIQRSEVLGLIKKAITKWIKEDPDGEWIWNHTEGDLNIGDVWNELDGGCLDDQLLEVGITSIEITIVSEGPAETAWKFDTVLANPEDLDPPGKKE